MRVLIIGHACSCHQGSEAAGTWNLAWQLSLRHEVLVLAFPHDRDAVDQFLATHSNRNLKFCWVRLPRYSESSEKHKHDRGVQSSPLYLLWQVLAYKKALELQKTIGFDIAHHVSYGSLSAPPVHALGIPFIWGPIGGGQRAPSSFRRYFGRSWVREIARNARVRMLPFSPFLRSTVRASLVTLATNQETVDLLRLAGARNVRLFLDSGIPQSFLSNGSTPKSDAGTLTLLWAGRMLPRKALPLALEALAEASDVKVRLLIAGDGEMRKSWEDCARRLRVQGKVTFLGAVPWENMPLLYRTADAFLFTSLRDSFGMQVLEAMGHALPILTLDHQGVGAFVPPDAGIKVPVTTPQETSKGIAEGIHFLARNPDARRRLGEAGRTFARTQTWEKRAEDMLTLYEELLSTGGASRLGAPAAYGSYAVTKRIATIDSTIDLKGKRVLDLGCGNGSYTAELAGRAASVCGVDILMPNLKAFRTQIPRLQAAGENLPFASEAFDAVTVIEVLEHTRCDGKVLEECCRVLKPGGLLVLFVPNKLYPFESHPCRISSLSIGRNIPLVSWLPKALRRHLCHARIYTRRALFLMAQQAGFQIQKSGYIFPPLDSLRLPFKELYRQLARWLEHSPFAMFGVSIYAVFKKPERLPESIRPLRNSRSSNIPSYETLGVRVHAVQISDVVAHMEQWIRERDRCRSIAATGMHGIVEAQHDPEFKQILNATELVVPDGMPLVWLGRRRRHVLPRRVYGPDLMLAFCEETQGRGYRHFFSGGEPGVAEQLAESLKRRFPRIQLAGTHSPPFRPLTREEDDEIVAMISHAAPDVLWVGLGTPKQERWMHELRSKLNVPVVVGVGAAFDMICGRRKQAPRWMREHGLEWFFRLCQEPRRLWQRYLIYGTEFVASIVLENLGLKRFAPTTNEGKPQTGALP